MEDEFDRPARGLGMAATRRQFLGGAAAVLGTLAAPAILRAQEQEITFATWGGSWEEAMRKAWFDPFTEKTGIKVTTVAGNSYGKIQAMVESGSTSWDLVEVLPDFQWIGAEKNLLEPIDKSAVDTSHVMPGDYLITDYSVPQVLFSRVVAYSTKLPGTPKSWGDLFDLEGFPGNRTLYAKVNGGLLEAALLADGVPADQLYPLDVERALAKLGTIREQILFYETNAQGEQYMSDGQASMGLLPDGRALNARRAGAPIDIQWETSLLTWSSMVVPRGAPNKSAAMAFLNYALTPEAQAEIAKVYTYGPVTPAAFSMIPEERAQTLSGGPQMEGAILIDEKWWAANRDSATEALNTWMLG